MAAVSGTIDILALAKDAFQLYHVYRDAQDRYRALCEDIIGLESTLKVLGNKLVFQGTSNNSGPSSRANLSASDAAVEDGVGGGGGLGPEESAALQQLIQKAQKLLQELHARVPATKLPRGLYRLKWSESEVQSVRSRITALNSSIAAFSSSLVVSHISFSARTEHSQQQILGTLREVLDAVQSSTANKPFSHADTLAAPKDGLGELQDHVFMQNLIYALGIKPRTGMGLRHCYRMLDNHIAITGSTMEFVIKNETMGGDPLFGNRKAFAMAWRKRAVRDGRILHSEPQCAFGDEGDTVTLWLDAPLPCIEEQQQQALNASGSPPEGRTQIVLASWSGVEVSARVAALVASGQTRILATNDDLHVADPKPEDLKWLSICWTYSRGREAGTPSATDFQTAIVSEGQHLYVPLCLRILRASKGDLDVTDLLQAMVSGQQTLTFDPNDIIASAPDSRPGIQKTISIAYRYGTRAMQLLVVPEGVGMVKLTPHGTANDSAGYGRIFDLDASKAIAIGGENKAATVLAIIWGLKLIPLETPSLREALQLRLLPCRNDFFGVDGWEGVVKTCQVFVQSGKSVGCFSTWELADLDLNCSV
ncbi:hypothetical protein LMH87_001527 [Akanthomyces muscarius]|uniref:Uncharacterized protein n=1 Tax=Akanthomyces muscarius TaxID=2231603 RepID=A0A9W8Q5V2_AKAMU|nr:hypothetical protein LMH87_001527 [Akanthomyces muscarius]KAJ4146974.1 hypothetical protein LMH87_001527 [Akanthomyces muscarius]